MLRQACHDVAAIQRVLGRSMRVAVNSPPHQIHNSGWLDEISAALDASGLEPSQLELEITEGLLMDERWGVFDTLHAIRDLGVRPPSTGFGQGYSSLADRTRFPIA